MTSHSDNREIKHGSKTHDDPIVHGDHLATHQLYLSRINAIRQQASIANHTSPPLLSSSSINTHRLSDLPRALLSYAFTYVDLSTLLGSCYLVCRSWHSLVMLPSSCDTISDHRYDISDSCKLLPHIVTIRHVKYNNDDYGTVRPIGSWLLFLAPYQRLQSLCINGIISDASSVQWSMIWTSLTSLTSIDIYQSMSISFDLLSLINHPSLTSIRLVDVNFYMGKADNQHSYDDDNDDTTSAQSPSSSPLSLLPSLLVSPRVRHIELVPLRMERTAYLMNVSEAKSLQSLSLTGPFLITGHRGCAHSLQQLYMDLTHDYGYIRRNYDKNLLNLGDESREVMPWVIRMALQEWSSLLYVTLRGQYASVNAHGLESLPPLLSSLNSSSSSSEPPRSYNWLYVDVMRATARLSSTSNSLMKLSTLIELRVNRSSFAMMSSLEAVRVLSPLTSLRRIYLHGLHELEFMSLPHNNLFNALQWPLPLTNGYNPSDIAHKKIPSDSNNTPNLNDIDDTTSVIAWLAGPSKMDDVSYITPPDLRLTPYVMGPYDAYDNNIHNHYDVNHYQYYPFNNNPILATVVILEADSLESRLIHTRGYHGLQLILTLDVDCDGHTVVPPPNSAPSSLEEQCHHDRFPINADTPLPYILPSSHMLKLQHTTRRQIDNSTTSRLYSLCHPLWAHLWLLPHGDDDQHRFGHILTPSMTPLTPEQIMLYKEWHPDDEDNDVPTTHAISDLD
jgi:hypothetical protein